MLNGKAAVVTGSTSGIGLGIARALAQEGAAVMLNGFGPPDQIQEAIRTVEAAGKGPVRHFDADVSDESACAAMIDAAVEAFGSVDILVNNAGIQHTASVPEFPIDRWHAVIGTNLNSVFFLTRKALPLMTARGWGRVINIASVHGLVASVNKSAYVAAKHGVVGLTKVTALETAGTGVTCNAICPGWVLTPLVQKQVDALAERKGLSKEDAAVELLSEKMPSKEFVQPEEIGGLAVFLCSDAARQITGASMTIDGAWTAQ